MPSADTSGPRKVICLRRKLHLEGLSFSPCSWNRFKYGLEPAEVVLLRSRIHNHIIKVYQSISKVQFSQAVLHEPLERSGCIAQPVRHSEKLVHAQTSHCKGSILPGSFRHLYLPKSGLQVHTGKESSSYHGLHGLLHSRKGVQVLLSSGIQLPKIDAKPESSVFFFVQGLWHYTRGT